MSFRPNLSLVQSVRAPAPLTVSYGAIGAKSIPCIETLIGHVTAGRTVTSTELNHDSSPSLSAGVPDGYAIWAGAPSAGTIDQPGLGACVTSYADLNALSRDVRVIADLTRVFNHNSIAVIWCDEIQSPDPSQDQCQALDAALESLRRASSVPVRNLTPAEALSHLISMPDSLEMIILLGSQRSVVGQTILSALGSGAGFAAVRLSGGGHLWFDGEDRIDGSVLIGGAVLALLIAGAAGAAEDLWTAHLSLMERRYFGDVAAKVMPYATSVAPDVYLADVFGALGDAAGLRTRHFQLTGASGAQRARPFLRVV